MYCNVPVPPFAVTATCPFAKPKHVTSVGKALEITGAGASTTIAFAVVVHPVDVLMLGESYHNDHHHNPSSINFGVRWFEIDPVYYVILLFEKLGIVKRTVSA